METRTRPKDPNDPREYLPVPQGGLMLLGQAGAVIIATAIGLGFLIAGYRIDHTAEDWSLTVLALTIETIGAVSMISTLYQGFRWMWPDARAYWLRNVRGYRLACWLGNGPFGRRELLCHAVIAPGNVLKSGWHSNVTLILPLGGWFRSPTVVMPKGQSLTPPLRRGQLRLRYALLRLGPYPEVLPMGAIAGHSIQIRDRYGDRMTTSVANAITIFEKHALCICTDQESALRDVVEGYQREAGQLERERDHEQEAHRHARHMWTNALIAIERAILEIAKTSRFVGSTEALRIRLSLLERFRDLVPAPDPKEPQRAKWIGWADEEIAKARADLARRDRHKRRPSAGAGT
ncbi:hypothetical protein HY634_04510 [Candidatus Uhrbacteria bacterium]|nr:hypothetical protein [Candidatus Uhrbacteria bacterium]